MPFMASLITAMQGAQQRAAGWASREKPNLQDACGVAYVTEEHAPQVAMPVHPAADCHLLASMLLPQLSTVVVPACPTQALLSMGGRQGFSLLLLCRHACAGCCCRGSEPVLPAGMFGSSSQAPPPCIWEPAQMELAAGHVPMQ